MLSIEYQLSGFDRFLCSHSFSSFDFSGINGAPEQNWCDMAGGCLNGGTCFNQCQDFWCDCGEVSALSVDHIGKRCEVTSDSKSVY